MTAQPSKCSRVWTNQQKAEVSDRGMLEQLEEIAGNLQSSETQRRENDGIFYFAAGPDPRWLPRLLLGGDVA